MPNITKELLLASPAPKQTKSYSPISHKDVIDISMEALTLHGLRVTSERYTAAQGVNKAQGYYNIDAGDSDMQIRLIWHNSYDRTMTLKWAIGANVIVCENGMVSGELGRFKKKHVGNIYDEYQETANLAANMAQEHFNLLRIQAEQMKRVEVTKRTSAELIGRMFLEEKIITAAQLNIIKDEIEKPSFEYNADGTLWQLYNHTTVALKTAHPIYYLNQHQAAHKFFLQNAE